MTIATAKEKSASERFMLVRITPARDVSASLSSAGSGVYTMTFPYPVAKVERNGAELTKVSSVSNNDEYSFDEDTQAFQVKLAAAPDSDDNIVVVYYHLFYTGGKSRIAPTDPESAESASNLLREWEPKLESYPRTRQSVKNGLVGVLTVDDMQLQLTNADHQFENYLTDADSFSNKDVAVWLCINSINNIQPAYVGKTVRVRLGDGVVSLSTLSPAAKLRSTAFMGDTADDVFADISDTNGAQANRPIPFIFGEYSQYKTQFRNVVNGLSDGANKQFATPEMLEAVCTSYVPNPSTSANRVWTLCRTNSNGLAGGVNTTVTGSTLADGTALPYTSAGGNLTLGFRTNAASGSFRVGDSVKVSASSTVYGLVYAVSESGGKDMISVQFRRGETDTAGVTFSSGNAIARVSSVGVVIKDPDGTIWNLVEGPDYTVSTSALSSGNKLTKITFANNFESAYSGIGTLSPDSHTVYFMVWTSTSNDWTHGSVVQSICEAAGLSVNTSSISTANAGLPLESLFCIPYKDETEPRNYIDYLEDIMSDMVAILTANSAGEIVYKVLTTPSDAETTDRTAVQRGSVDVQLDYDDIVTTVILTNSNIKTIKTQGGSLLGDSDTLILSSNAARYLHGQSTTYTRRNCTAASLSAVAARILNLRKNRSVTYQLSTATQHIDAQVGDDLTLETPDALGGSGTTNLKIISIDKSTDKTTIEATDLKGL